MDKGSKGKPLAALVLEADDAAPEADGMGGEDAAAEEAVAAAKAGDAPAFKAAMIDMIRICIRKYGKAPAYTEE